MTNVTPTDAAVRQAEEVLQAGIESSLTGVLDVEALLYSTMFLTTNLEMLPPPLGADIHHTREYILLNPPSGVNRAEVWIGAPTGPDGYQALSLRVQLERRVRPYVVGGAARLGPEIDLTVITDKSGEFLEHRVLTRLNPAIASSEIVNQVAPGSAVVEGVACLLDTTGKGKNSITFLGYKDGKPHQWDGSIALAGVDPAEKWSEFRKIMWTRLQEIKRP